MELTHPQWVVHEAIRLWTSGELTHESLDECVQDVLDAYQLAASELSALRTPTPRPA